MNIGIFDPYLDTLGGGEKYILEFAECLSSDNQVSLFWNVDQEEHIRRNAKERFNLSLKKINFTNNIFNSKTSLASRLLITRKYDVIFFVSDGSIPLLLSKKNILLFQFPVNWVKADSFLNRIKLKRISKVICYSNFVKKFLDKTFSINSFVLPPYVDISFPKSKKENIILSVGRFTRGMNTKKQDILIDIFKKISFRIKGWKLVLIGSVLPEDKDFVDFLRKKSRDYSIEVLTNVSSGELRRFYAKARIYWHASGFREDLERHPERAEHFGISTVEAMAGGAVPIVIDAGGQKEIVENNVSGFLWTSVNEFIEKTEKLISGKDLWKKMSEEAVKRSKRFSKDRFCREVKELL